MAEVVFLAGFFVLVESVGPEVLAVGVEDGVLAIELLTAFPSVTPSRSFFHSCSIRDRHPIVTHWSSPTSVILEYTFASSITYRIDPSYFDVNDAIPFIELDVGSTKIEFERINITCRFLIRIFDSRAADRGIAHINFCDQVLNMKINLGITRLAGPNLPGM